MFEDSEFMNEFTESDNLSQKLTVKIYLKIQWHQVYLEREII